MTYIYYIDGEKFTTDHQIKTPWGDISSPNEDTPAIEDLKSEYKFWCEKGDIAHRLTGPAYISNNGTKSFYLNNKHYDNVTDWLKDHPNQDNAFQVEMLLKYA
jgi:hypothetical protein